MRIYYVLVAEYFYVDAFDISESTQTPIGQTVRIHKMFTHEECVVVEVPLCHISRRLDRARL